MPQPPILPVLDWSSIFNSGLTWAEWLKAAENAKHRATMEEAAETLQVAGSPASALAAIATPVHVVAIAEDWCGDVVRHAPVLEAIARAQPLVRVAYITRAAHPDVFVRFLTNGGEAIPKFIFLSRNFVEVGNWGPMQADCRHLISQGKAAGNVSRARELVSSIYKADTNRDQVFTELTGLATLAATESLD